MDVKSTDYIVYWLFCSVGVGSSLEAWRTFLTQTLTGALAAPQDLFKKVEYTECHVF